LDLRSIPKEGSRSGLMRAGKRCVRRQKPIRNLLAIAQRIWVPCSQWVPSSEKEPPWFGSTVLQPNLPLTVPIMVRRCRRYCGCRTVKCVKAAWLATVSCISCSACSASAAIDRSRPSLRRLLRKTAPHMRPSARIKALQKRNLRATIRRRSLLHAISLQRRSPPSQSLGPGLSPRLLRPHRPKPLEKFPRMNGLTATGRRRVPRRWLRLPFALPQPPRSLRGNLSQARSRHRRQLCLLSIQNSECWCPAMKS
jgi:hypothetical protein